MKIYKCEVCGQTFENPKVKANHVRWQHKDNSKYLKKFTKIAVVREQKNMGNLKCSM